MRFQIPIGRDFRASDDSSNTERLAVIISNRFWRGRLGERADVLGFHLQRVDGTSHPHYLYHLSNPAFFAHWAAISVRAEPKVVLSMFGSGSFWHREVFNAVAQRAEPFPMYLEIYLPTLAHHLGFRVRDYGEQNRFVHNLGERSSSIEQARAEGAWTLHPVKELGNQKLA